MESQAVIVPGTLDSLALIRECVREAAGEASLDKKRTYRLQLAVDEIASNIVIHGYMENNLAGDIEIKREIDADSLTITLVDSAIPYDPLSRPLPDDLDAPLENRAIGGLGVYLAVNNVDAFLYRFVDGQNHNIFVVKRETEPAQPSAQDQ